MKLLLLNLIVVLISCKNGTEIKPEIDNFIGRIKDTNLVELYRTFPNKSAIILYKTSNNYYYGRGSCQGIYKDSGIYLINKNTISFKSTINKEKDTAWLNNDFYENINTNDKLFFEKGKLTFNHDDKFDTSFSFYRVALKGQPQKYLDVNGEGYLISVDSLTGENIEVGYYKNSILFNGERLINREKLIIDTIRNGKKTNRRQ